jgi:dTDP-4-dehydrorhamnose reductase
MEVLVLGSNGLLGSQVVKALMSANIQFIETQRQKLSSSLIQYRFEKDDLSQILLSYPSIKYIVNCIGVIPQRNFNSNLYDVNWKLPSLLETLSNQYGFRIIQIATDCVYDGSRGFYSEADSPNPIDAYGKSKLLGEIESQSFMHLRCSIIGKDRDSRSLYSWLLSHSMNSRVNGYTNHIWNGITTLAFSRITAGIIQNDSFFPGTHHLVPSTSVSKYELLKLIAIAENRLDLEIIPYEDKVRVDRTLATLKQAQNRGLWKLGGYDSIPSIQEMVSEFGLLNQGKRYQI